MKWVNGGFVPGMQSGGQFGMLFREAPWTAMLYIVTTTSHGTRNSNICIPLDLTVLTDHTTF